MKKLIFALLLIASPAFAQITLSGSQIQIGPTANANIDVLSASKAYGTIVSKQNQYVTVAHGNIVNLIDYSGGPGYLASMWFNINTGDTAGVDGDTINVYYDGHSSPDISMTVQQFFGSYGTASGSVYINRYMSYVKNTSGGTLFGNYQWRVPMPFTSGIKIDIVNNGATDTFFSEVMLETGVSNIWPNTRHLYATTFAQTACTLGTTVNLANITSGAGRVFGVQWYMSGGTANDQEGDFAYYTNGGVSPIYQSSGAEDFFETGHNWQGATLSNWSLAGGQLGVYIGSIGVSAPDPVGAYRFHIDDPIVFTNGFKLTWMCGDPSEGSVGNPNVNSTVWYLLGT